MFYLLLIIVIVVLIARSRGRCHVIQETPTAPIPKSPYRVRFSVMNGSEEAFFLELQKQLPQDFYAFPKVRIADILETKDGHGYYQNRNKILPKHVDFLICDRSFRPKMAIEINGSSHKSYKRRFSDHIKQEVFGDLRFPLKVVNVGENFSNAIQEIVNQLKNQTNAN